MTRHRTFRVLATRSETFFIDLAARDEASALLRAKTHWNAGRQTCFHSIGEIIPVEFELDGDATLQLGNIANEDRARWAKKALQAFTRDTDSAMGEDALHDLLCDLGHYARSIGLDASDALRRAADVTTSEIEDEARS